MRRQVELPGAVGTTTAMSPTAPYRAQPSEPAAHDITFPLFLGPADLHMVAALAAEMPIPDEDLAIRGARHEIRQRPPAMPPPAAVAGHCAAS